MPRNITFTIIIYCEPEHKNILFIRKLSCVEIMRCEVDKTGMHNFSFWNKKNNIEEFSDSDEDSK